MARNDGFRKTIEMLRMQKRAAHSLDRTSVRAGWIDGAMTLDNRTPFAVIARTLCYGRESGTTRKGWKYPAIPARNFMRAFSQDISRKAEREAGKCLQLVFTKGAEYQADVTKALAPLGATASGGLRYVISHDRYKRNARSTVMAWAKRHSNSTRQMKKASRLAGDERFLAFAGMKKELVDTGALIQHITYDIVKR